MMIAPKGSVFLAELKRQKLYFIAVVLFLLVGCRPAEDAALTVDVPLHLEEHLDAAIVTGSEVRADLIQPVEWRFDEPQPGWRAAIPRPFPPGIRPAEVSQTDEALQITLGPSNANPRGVLVGGVYYYCVINYELPSVPQYGQQGKARARTSARSTRIVVMDVG